MIIGSLVLISHLLTASIQVSHCSIWNRKANKGEQQDYTNLASVEQNWQLFISHQTTEL